MKGKLKKLDKSKLPVYEIIVEDGDETGISLISLVEDPAIVMKGMTFNEEKSFLSFKEADGEKQIIVGPALIPGMRIYREDDKFGEYYVVFSKETIEKMVEKFNKYGSNRKINVDHSNQMVDAFIMEDWIVEDEVYDKSRKYGIEVPVGTYMIMVKIEDKNFWNTEVKGNSKFGFSIEGLLGQQLVSLSREYTIDDLTEKDLLQLFTEMEYKEGVPHYIADGRLYIGATHKDASGRLMTGATHTENSKYLYHEDELEIKCFKCGWSWNLTDGGKDPYICHECGTDNKPKTFESYRDYPDGVKSNAKKVLDYTEKNGWGSCGTGVGKQRANQLAKGEPISLETIKRMYSYLSRHEADLESSKSYSDGCGKLMYDAWGGKAALGWSRNKLRELGELDENMNFSQVFITDSANVDRMKYFEEEEKLVIRFNDGEYYTYTGVSASLFKKVLEGDAACITSGSNEFGEWEVGKFPSVGAAVYKFLVKGNVDYQPGGSF